MEYLRVLLEILADMRACILTSWMELRHSSAKLASHVAERQTAKVQSSQVKLEGHKSNSSFHNTRLVYTTGSEGEESTKGANDIYVHCIIQDIRYGMRVYVKWYHILAEEPRGGGLQTRAQNRTGSKET